MKVDDADAVLMFCMVFGVFFIVLTSSKPNINFISEIKVIIILWFFPKRKQQICRLQKDKNGLSLIKPAPLFPAHISRDRAM